MSKQELFNFHLYSACAFEKIQAGWKCLRADINRMRCWAGRACVSDPGHRFTLRPEHWIQTTRVSNKKDPNAQNIPRTTLKLSMEMFNAVSAADKNVLASGIVFQKSHVAPQPARDQWCESHVARGAYKVGSSRGVLVLGELGSGAVAAV